MTLWDRILTSLQSKINTQSFNTWLRPTQQLSLDGGDLRVEVPSLLFADWISKNYLNLIHEAAHELDCGDLRLSFTSRQAPAVSTAQPPSTNRTPELASAGASIAAAAAPRGSATLAHAPERPSPVTTRNGLHPRYTFDSFVVSSCNQFAHAAATAVADQPSGAYNPLYVYGGVGLGKTHLMHAIGHKIARHLPGLRALYISSETFMNELINSIRFERTIDFKERYRNVDLLLIDDIQFLAGKERTQEEFFHTFNALYESQKQIVMTSDCPPRDIPTLEERLRSRFEWGLIADIQPPDLETKVALPCPQGTYRR